MDKRLIFASFIVSVWPEPLVLFIKNSALNSAETSCPRHKWFIPKEQCYKLTFPPLIFSSPLWQAQTWLLTSKNGPLELVSKSCSHKQRQNSTSIYYVCTYGSAKGAVPVKLSAGGPVPFTGTGGGGEGGVAGEELKAFALLGTISGMLLSASGISFSDSSSLISDSPCKQKYVS